MKKYLIGIDVGTSATKAALYDTEGNEIDSVSCEYPLYQPENGWAEQEPEDWWRATSEALKRLTASVCDGEIAGVGLTGQMHSLVMLGKDDKPLRRAILWCDGRTSKECELIEETVGHERLIEITANPALPGFTASKIVWVKNHQPEIYEKCAHILLPKDYIRLKLTGEYATDVSDASGMQLFNVKKREHSKEICEALGIDYSLLGKVYESSEISGYVTKQASEATGLPVGCIVAAGASDNAAAAIGVGVCADGDAFTTVGTSGVVFVHTEEPKIDPLGRVHTFCAAVPGEWHVMGVTQAAGLSVSHFKEIFGKDTPYGEYDDACLALPIGSEKLIYLPYLMGERTPVLDSNARGVFFGLSALHTKEHMARAVYEGVAFSLYSCLDVFREMNITTKGMAMCGGGAKGKLLPPMLSDVYGLKISPDNSGKGASLGAAILAGCAAGIYDSVREGCRRAVRLEKEILPDMKKREKYLEFYGIYKSLYPVLKGAFKSLSEVKK